MKFWKQDIQVLYWLRLNPSNNSPNDFEQYSALKNGPFHYIMKVDFWRKKWQLYPKKILQHIDEFLKMKKLQNFFMDELTQIGHNVVQ